jgi:adenine-specific DNA-methyltransferase
VYKKPLFQPNKKNINYSIEKFCWKITELSDGKTEEIGGRKVVIFKAGEYKIDEIEPSLKGLKETWATGSLVKQGGSAAEFFDLYLSSRKEEDGLNTLYKVIDMGTKGDGLGYRYISGPKKITATKGKFYSGIPIDKFEDIKLGQAKKEIPIANFYDFSGSFGNCRLEGRVGFNGGKKPEDLISMIIEIGSKEDDLILDSFLGSGTTAAVAHKMGRRWIGIEMGEHCDTHCLPRLKAVVDGSDMGGIGKSVGWSGGGGFAYYSLAPSLIRIDEFGQAVIDERYNADMLAAAMARHEGFVYSPDAKLYWKQGVTNDTDYIYTTTGHITPSMLDTLAEGLKEGESLVVCAKSFDEGCKGRSKKITLKKIPQAVMDKCEYKPDGYPLNIVNPPIFDDEEEEE